MTIFNSVFTWFMKKRIYQIELFMKYPNEVQEEWFEQLISSAEHTEWGKKYGYKSITSLDQFKERVPIQNYDTLKPYIERMLRGKKMYYGRQRSGGLQNRRAPQATGVNLFL